MGSLERRLQALEVGAPCEVCRTGPGPIEYEVVWEDKLAPISGPKRCPGCGWRLVYVVTWGVEA